MGVAHYLPYGEQLVMGSWRRAERLIRCEINRFSLRRGRSALHNIGGPPPYGTPNGKTQTVDFAVLSHLGRGYFRPIRQRIAWLWPIHNGEHMRAGSLPGRDGAFASSPLPALPIRHVMGVAHYLPRSALPKVPGRGCQGVAGRPPGRTLARALFPCRLHLAGTDRRYCLSEQGGRL